jgi:very-short-patch-repair endonuclease
MRIRRDNNRRLIGFARQMRKSATDSEAKLWSILRGSTLNGHKFRRQYPIGGYIVDFYCVRRRLAVELDGGQHFDPDAIDYDRKRSARLNQLGVRVVRYSDYDLLKDPNIVAEEILRLLEEEPSPLPSPGVPGEGERDR